MGQELIRRASQVSAVVILTGVLVLAGRCPRPASGVRSLSLATLVAALLAAVSLAILFLIGVFFPLCGYEGPEPASCGFADDLGYALVPAMYLLYVAAVGLCLLTAVAASVSLARAGRWGRLPLVGVLGVLPLAYIGAVWEIFRLATGPGPYDLPNPWFQPYLATIVNSAPLAATLSLLPLLIYSLFFYRFPR